MNAEYLRKLNRAATSFVLLVLHMAHIARTTPEKYAGKPIKCPAIMSQHPAPNSKSQKGREYHKHLNSEIRPGTGYI